MIICLDHFTIYKTFVPTSPLHPKMYGCVKPGILVDYRDYRFIVLYVKSSVEGGFKEILLKSLRVKCTAKQMRGATRVAAPLQADAACTNRQCEREATGDFRRMSCHPTNNQWNWLIFGCFRSFEESFHIYDESSQVFFCVSLMTQALANDSNNTWFDHDLSCFILRNSSKTLDEMIEFDQHR